MKSRYPMSPVLLVILLVSSSWASPVADANGVLDRREATDTCCAKWIKAAKTRANHGPRQTISTLCSSLQNKYKTVTHTIYTKTVTPTTTVLGTKTATDQIIRQTITDEVTQQTADYLTSTSIVDVTATLDVTDVVATTTAVVTIQPRKEYPCQQIESILHLGDGAATPFCSCYETGPTSTHTVTCREVSTAPPTRVTHYATITPAPSTIDSTIYQTTTEVFTDVSGVVITETVTQDVTQDVTQTVTATSTPLAAPLTSGLLQFVSPGSPFNGFLATLNFNSNSASSSIEFTASSSDTFLVRNGVLYDSNGYQAYQDAYNSATAIYAGDNGLYIGSGFGDTVAYPFCDVEPSGQVSCTEDGSDTRTLFLVCSYFGSTPFLVLTGGPAAGCVPATLYFVAP